RGAGGSFHVALAPYARDGAVFDEKGGAFKGRFAIAGDQACAFVERGAGGRARLGIENERRRGERQDGVRRGPNLHDGADYIGVSCVRLRGSITIRIRSTRRP